MSTVRIASGWPANHWRGLEHHPEPGARLRSAEGGPRDLHRPGPSDFEATGGLSSGLSGPNAGDAGVDRVDDSGDVGCLPQDPKHVDGRLSYRTPRSLRRGTIYGAICHYMSWLLGSPATPYWGLVFLRRRLLASHLTVRRGLRVRRNSLTTASALRLAADAARQLATARRPVTNTSRTVASASAPVRASMLRSGIGREAHASSATGGSHRPPKPRRLAAARRALPRSWRGGGGQPTWQDQPSSRNRATVPAIVAAI